MKCVLLKAFSLRACSLPAAWIITCLALPVLAEEYHFTTMAGRPGTEAADGTNTAAIFAYPFATVHDSEGNLFVAESTCVRKIRREGTNWITTTIAGTPGFGGLQDGTNGDARFNGLKGIAVDASGNLFVSDGFHTIRRIAPSGTNWVVTTWAGRAGLAGYNNGSGSSARFDRPKGLAIDSAGNLYVADSGNHVIRKVTTSGTEAQVTLFLGVPRVAGSADGSLHTGTFNMPAGLATDSANDLYVADSDNHLIRKISTKYFLVKTLAGTAGAVGWSDGTNGAAQFQFPAGIVVVNTNLAYVADAGNHTIRKLSISGTNTVVDTIAGIPGVPGSADGTNGSSWFNHPQGLGLDGAGNLVVSDTDNNTIRLLVPEETHFVSRTVAGLASAHRTDGPGPLSTFWWPHKLTLDGAGNLYVADRQNHAIRQLSWDGNGWQVSTIAGVPGVSGYADGPAINALFNRPQGVVADARGNLYVADTFNRSIRKIASAGTNRVVSTLAGAPDASGVFTHPQAITVDALGNLYVADVGVIRMLKPEGTNWVVSNLAGGFSSPSGIALGHAGDIYIAGGGDNAIFRVSLVGDTWETTTIAGMAGWGNWGNADGTNSVARFREPGCIAVLEDKLFVADAGNHTIRKLTKVGDDWVVETIAGAPEIGGATDGVGNTARFFLPSGIAVDRRTGDLFVADTRNNTIRRGEPGPSLKITGQPGHTTLAWQTWAANYTLETSSNLATSSSWVALTNGTDCVTLTNQGAPHIFYRLRR